MPSSVSVVLPKVFSLVLSVLRIFHRCLCVSGTHEAFYVFLILLTCLTARTWGSAVFDPEICEILKNDGISFSAGNCSTDDVVRNARFVRNLVIGFIQKLKLSFNLLTGHNALWPNSPLIFCDAQFISPVSALWCLIAGMTMYYTAIFCK